MYLVFDIGGTYVKYGLFNLEKKLIEKNKFNTPKNLENLLNNFAKIIAKYNNVKAIALSAPGSVNTKTGVILGESAVKFIHGLNFKTIFKERFNYEIAIENDANCAALAQIHFGTNSKINNLIYIVIGSGIGGSVIVNRKIVHGSHLFGGEFGYMIMNNKLEIYSNLASTRALIEQVHKIEEFKYLKGEMILNHLDARIKRIVNNFCKIHAIAIYNLQHAFDPEVVVLGGGISDNPKLVQLINMQIEKIYAIKQSQNKPKIIVGEFKSDANLYGALANLLYHNQ